MRIDILTLFPRIFAGPLEESIIGKARERGLLSVQVHDIRNYASGKHRQADDAPYGGGPGMVLMPDPVYKAVDDVLGKSGQKSSKSKPKVILMSPSGQVLSQQKAIKLSKEEYLLIICGRYEGVDDRVREKLSAEEISIGDYVLTGGEIPAMVLLDSVVRQVPGVVGEDDSLKSESFYEGLLDHPSYTRPEKWEGMSVPEVLVSGDHEKVRQWRRKESLRRTFQKRPDLLASADLSKEDAQFLKEVILEG
jgi:tRNA (guanine37-N1)-methyltransferase